MQKIINETDEIKWSNNNCFVVREEGLCETPYDYVAVGEVYCKIFQTPSTPADFGLATAKKKAPRTIDGASFDSPADDEFIRAVTNFDYIHPKGIRGFILGEEGFYNWYDEKK